MHTIDERQAMRWWIATGLVALVLCLLQLRWQAIDRVPPAWDQTGYLIRTP
jgi:hypothetical protein